MSPFIILLSLLVASSAIDTDLTKGVTSGRSSTVKLTSGVSGRQWEAVNRKMERADRAFEEPPLRRSRLGPATLSREFCSSKSRNRPVAEQKLRSDCGKKGGESR